MSHLDEEIIARNKNQSIRFLPLDSLQENYLMDRNMYAKIMLISYFEYTRFLNVAIFADLLEKYCAYCFKKIACDAIKKYVFIPRFILYLHLRCSAFFKISGQFFAGARRVISLLCFALSVLSMFTSVCINTTDFYIIY